VRRARPDSTHYLVNVYEGVEVASLDPRPSRDMGSGDVTSVPGTDTAPPGLPAETVDPDVLHVQTLVGMCRKR
jgi:hypothetical protein